MRSLYKTTVVIWSEFDGSTVELSDLARDAESGESYCSIQKTELIVDPLKDPDWDGTEFFDIGDEDDEDWSEELALEADAEQRKQRIE